MIPFIVLMIVCFASVAMGQQPLGSARVPLPSELTFGQYPFYVVLTAVTMAMFRFWQVNDRYKAPITVGLGVFLGVLWLYYAGVTCYVTSITDAVLYGIMQGLAAVGLYEVQDKFRSATTAERK